MSHMDVIDWSTDWLESLIKSTDEGQWLKPLIKIINESH